MADISKEQAVQLAREAWNDESEPIPEWLSALAESLFKLGRNAGLEEATRECRLVKTAHANEWLSFPADPKMVKATCIAAIESLKDNTP